ncbi:4F2 cell-surface antigen heavy chain-like [Scaptodrosophila lebanonensis]|uniref:4F2 cell-surface antigen heavy chain-like n=1 Tax=Drosophila lebanonensis TaxID=7225 RepID=A0A6J2U7A5_DROLE|nr:4F2 cell-surface antigen heavy chain-like [Scaptodrosophila lebanonensis]
MENMGLSTNPSFLDVELSQTLITSPSISTLMHDEEASICPLLSNNNISGPLEMSHPLSANCTSKDVSLSNANFKAETSSSGSSTGLAMDASESPSTNLFNKTNYQNLQNTNVSSDQESSRQYIRGNMHHSEEAPLFVSWNWPLIRKFTLFIFLSALLAMCSVVVAKIAQLPKTCNPKTAWYRGSVFYEIFPASFQDSDNDGIGDIGGILNRMDYLASLGVSAVRLNSIFDSAHYPDDYDNPTSITRISSVIGKVTDIKNLANALHQNNMKLILDLPLRQVITKGISNEGNFNDLINGALIQWISHGVDGFYLKGLDKFASNFMLGNHLALWKRNIGSNVVLMVEESTFMNKSYAEIADISNYIDLVDIRLNVGSGAKAIDQRIKYILTQLLPPKEDGAWAHWSIGGVDSFNRISQVADSPKFALATTIMQLMLPGTPSIFYGDEIAIESALYPNNERNDMKHLHHLVPMAWPNATHQFTSYHTLPWISETSSYNFEYSKLIAKMISLRDHSPSLYKNVICKQNTKLPNTQIHHSNDDIIMIERSYPRRNSFVSITNLKGKNVTLDLTSLFYSGNQMLTENEGEKIYFNSLEILPLETIVVKLDK